ncbi:patatin-like phospholipase RssA [Acidihalobacter prosperus]|uniref:Patatin n=1 Tax=Acidihalobacter prosperus TaxID=160660 RepID=A0A1A6C8J7_9GAMM|nr:patatin-like phospholipase RssA [Acidihalobacter prosperus]OBS10892.1 patatin [Acidihalobacter prosperus]
MKRPRIGLALGSGSARGWAHIGIIRALKARGIEPDVVTGTSIGALVGAAYVTGMLDPFGEWVERLTWREMVSLLDVRFNGGLIDGARLLDALESLIPEHEIATCRVPYGAIATDLTSGNEVWLREGSILAAVRASIALPGLFSPIQREGRWLVDGGLVNPVPVSLCRALGADIVIAVDLNSDLLRRHEIPDPEAPDPPPLETQVEEGALTASPWMRWLTRLVRRSGDKREVEWPSILEVVARSLNIMSVRITRSRMAGDPPDVLLAPRLAHIGLMEFHRAEEAIGAGLEEVERNGAELDALLGHAPRD